MVNGGKYNASIGIKLPNGTYEGTIGKDRLFWVRPGKGSLKKILQDKSVESKHYQHLCQAVGQKKKKKKKKKNRHSGSLSYFSVIHNAHKLPMHLLRNLFLFSVFF